MPLPFKPNLLGAKEGASSQPVATHSLFVPISIQPLAKSSFPLSLFLASFSFFRTRSTVALFFLTFTWSTKQTGGPRRPWLAGGCGLEGPAPALSYLFVSVRNRGYPSCPCFSCTGPWGRGHAVHTWCPRRQRRRFQRRRQDQRGRGRARPAAGAAAAAPAASPHTTLPLKADWCRRAPRRSNPRGAPHPNARPHVKM